MILKTKYGTEINTDEIGQGYGQFGEYMRKHVDSEWGMGKQREITKTSQYKVTVSGVANVSGTIYIEAESEDDARQQALKESENIDWDFVYSGYVDDIEVYEVIKQDDD